MAAAPPSTTFANPDAGEEFSNNLFSDLAPLLALFGGQVATQFMAESMGWADNIIFSMAPIGVLTAVVGAIRVGGATWLKALIGRAKENIAVAESELMSSTSDEVCEVFNGMHVVRLMGKPSIKELIFMEYSEDNLTEAISRGESFLTLSEAIAGRHLTTKVFPEYPLLQEMKREIKLIASWVLKKKKGFRLIYKEISRRRREGERLPIHGKSGGVVIPSQSRRVKIEESISSGLRLAVKKCNKSRIGARVHTFLSNTHSRTQESHDLSEKPPNISLNVHTRDGREELHVVAAIGTILQLGVLIFEWFITYHPTFKQQKGGRDMRAYAFPLTCIGTLVIVSGMLICSYIIESATTDQIHRSNGESLGMLWIQKGGSVDDQLFDSYLILAREKRNNVITSRRQGRGRGDRTSFITATLTTIGSVVTVIGFILQFVGLRSMTWSASISQLVATLIMVILRAYVRRGLSKSPWANPLPKGHEIDWLATRMSKEEDLNRLLGRHRQQEDKSHWYCSWPREISVNPWNDSNKDGFWDQGTFEWNVQAVGDMDRYGSLRKPLHPAVESISMHHVKIRTKLRFSTGWSGPALEQAIRVASAIEAFMNAFFPKKWKEKMLVWSINDRVVGETVFTLKRDNNLMWKANVAEIEAFLSLWLFSVAQKESNSTENIRKGMEENLSGTASKNHSLRCLAPMDGPILQCMYWWLGSAIALVREAKIESPGTGGTGALFIELNTPKEHVLSQVQDPFGKIESAQAPRDIPSMAQSIGFERHRIVGYQVAREDSKTLAVVSDAPLEVLYAQELFSAFIRSFVQFQPMIGQIEGLIKSVPVQEMNDSGAVFFESIGLEHKELNRVVKAISRSGLGSVEDIMLCTLPPLIVEGKILDNTAVVYAIRDHGRVQESYKRWRRAGELYVKGVITFESGYWKTQSRAIDQATCALAEFIRELTLEIKISEQYRQKRFHGLTDRRFERSAELDIILQEAIKALEKNGNKVSLCKIRSLYNLQNRGGEIFHSILNSSSPEETHPDLIAPEFWTILHNIVAKNLHHTFRKQMQETKSRSASERGGSSEIRPDPKDFAGLTPLHYATNVEYAKSLLGAGASITTKGHDGSTPLHSAARMGRKDVVELLVEHGSDLNPRDNHRRTPLHWAAHKGHHEVVGLLLGRGAAPQVVSDHRRNPLHMAACEGHLQAVRTMIESGKVDIGAADSDGRTALHLAVAGDHGDLVDFLSKGEHSWPTDHSGWAAIHLAVFLGRARLVDGFLHTSVPKEEIEKRWNLRTSKFGRSLLHIAAQYGQVSIAKSLVDRMKAASQPIDVLDNNGDTALMCAASCGHSDIVEILLKSGSELGILNKKRQSAVHLVADGKSSGRLAVLKVLLSRADTIDIDTKDEAGYTPLLRASISGQTSIVEVLIAKCDINAADNNGNTALHHAVQGRGPDFEALIKILVSRGADVKRQNNKNDSPLDLPAARGKDSLKMLFPDIGDTSTAKEGPEGGVKKNTLKRLGKSSFGQENEEEREERSRKKSSKWPQ